MSFSKKIEKSVLQSNPEVIEALIWRLHQKVSVSKDLNQSEQKTQKIISPIIQNNNSNKVIKEELISDESEARSLFLNYVRNPEKKDTLSKEHIQITKLFKCLSALSHGDKNWIEDLDEELLDCNPEIENENAVESETQHKSPYENVAQLTDQHLFLPISDELWNGFDEDVESACQPQESKGLSHEFLKIDQDAPPDDRTVFQIHADEYGKSSEWEGSSFEPMVNYASNYLKKRKVKIDPSVIEVLDSIVIFGYVAKQDKYGFQDEKPALEQMDSSIKTLRLRIEGALENKKNLLFAGGWKGDPDGHAIYYEIIPESSDTATFRLYNLGEGSEFHPSVQCGNKVKHQCYCEWKSVPITKLTSTCFLQALYEMRSFSEMGYKLTNYNGRDVYEALKGILFDTTADETSLSKKTDAYRSSPHLLMSPHRAGVCPWKGLLAFLRAYMDPEDYKLFICDIKLQSLLDSVTLKPLASNEPKDLMRNESQESLKKLHLVVRSHQALCRSLLKLHRQKIIGDTYLNSALPHLNTIANWYEERIPALYDRKANTRTFEYYSSLYAHPTKNPHALEFPLSEICQQSGGSKILQPCQFVMESFQNLPSSATSIENTLDTATSIAEKAWMDQEDIALHKGLILLISRLELDLDFWESVIAKNGNKSEKIITQLGELSRYLFKSCFTIPNAYLIPSEKIYAFIKILFLQQLICRLGHPNSAWDGLQVFLYDFPLPHNFFFHFPQYKMHRELITIKESTNTPEPSNYANTLAFYKFPSAMEEEIGLQIKFEEDRFGPKGNSFEDRIRKEYPQTIDKIQENKSEYIKAQKHVKDAYIYSSEYLPPWLKSIRDTFLAFEHLKSSGVANLKSIDRKADIEPKFVVEESGKCKITLSGVDNSINEIEEVKKVKPVEFGRNNAGLRYIGADRVEKSDELVELEQSLGRFYGWTSNEKELLLASEPIRGMSESDFKEIAHTLLNKTLIETLEFFTKNPDKLKEPIFRLILESSIFKLGALDSSLKINGFENQLSRFIQKKYVHFREDNNIQTTVFFLRLAHHLKGFCPNQLFFNTTTEELKKLLSCIGLTPQERSLICAELNAELGSKEHLNEDDLIFLLSGSVYIQENCLVQLSKSEPLILKEALETITLRASEIQTLLGIKQPNEKILNGVLKILRPNEEDKTWEIKLEKDQFPSFHTTDGDYSYYPLTGNLISKEGQTLLPAAILQNPLFRQQFPLVERGSPLPGNVYSFLDSKGRETLISMNQGNLVVEQNWGNEGWHRLVPSHLMQHRYFVENCTFWMPLQKEKTSAVTILAMDENTSRKYHFEVTIITPFPLEFKIESIIDCGDQSTLSYKGSLAGIEDGEYTLAWFTQKNAFDKKSEHRLVKVELPRFQLSFRLDQNKQLICDQFPKYAINPTKPIPEMGTYHRFLLLENKGKFKILLPKQKMETHPYEKKEVLLPRFKPQQNMEKGAMVPQHYLIFDLQKDGSLKNKTREDNLYLIYIFAVTQNYEKAAHYFKRKYTEALSTHSPTEVALLEDICAIAQVTGDRSGNALALRLHAHYLLLKNSLFNHQEPSKEKIEALRLEYQAYLIHYPHATALKLDKQEELLILKTVLKLGFDTSLYLRLKELDPAMARQVSLPMNTDLDQEKTDLSLEKFSIPSPGFSDNKPEDHVFLTRATREILSCFYHYYRLAMLGTPEEKSWLRNALHFVRIDSHPNAQHIAAFFQALLDAPTEFPPPYQNDSYRGARNTEANKQWKEKALAAAISVHKNTARQNSSDGSKLREEITPKNFRLDEKILNTSPLILPFEAPKLESFSSLCSEKQYFVIEDTLSKDVTDVGGLVELVQECKNDDPVHSKEIDRLQEDIEIYQNQPGEVKYVFSKEGCVLEIKQSIASYNQDSSEQLEILEREIYELANQHKPSAIHPLHLQLKKGGGLHKVITLEELILNFGKQKPEDLIRRNPSLSNADVNALYTKICSYLMHATRLQQGIKAQKTLKKLERAEQKDNLANQLAEELLAERRYTPEEYPAYLVFEHRAHMLMRKANIEKLEEFLQTGDINLVMEMIMGSGKSKVLLPLLGLLRANGKQLSMVIVPAPLFESIAHDTQNILFEMGHLLESLHFDRDTQFTKESLEAILIHLKNIEKEGKCLIMTSKSVHCLLLKFIEKSFEHFTSTDPSKELPAELVTLRKVLNCFRTKGYPLIEEADTILNVMLEVCFSLGKGKAPNPHELKLSALIYSHVFMGDLFKAYANLESDPSSDRERTTLPPFSKEIYSDKIKLPLTKAVIESLKTADLYEVGSLNQMVKEFFASLNEEDTEHLIHYLCRDPEHRGSAQQFYNQLKPEIQNIVALAGEEISHLLPFTLMQVSYQKYGLDDDSTFTDSQELFAIPYFATRSPSKGSSFANTHVVINYTLQTYMKIGISVSLIESQMKLLQVQAIKEMENQSKMFDLQDTAAWKSFLILRGNLNIPLFNYKPCHLEEIYNRINASPNDKIAFVTSILLPQMKIFPKKISSNPHLFIALFLKRIGFTGTLWNAISMHHALTPKPAAGTDAKTLCILWKNSRTNIVCIKEGTTEQMLAQLREKQIPFDMISDSGGYFKEGTNSQIAHEIASKQGREVVFYNAEGKQMISEGNKEIALELSSKSEEERITFLDESHTIGADVTQKWDAISLVTVRRKMRLRDLLQSVWRLRGLDKSQKARFLITEEVDKIIRQTLKIENDRILRFDEILAFAIYNQTQEQGRDNYKALRQELEMIPQLILLKILLDESLTPQAQAVAFHLLESHWIQSTDRSAHESYGILDTEIESSLVVKKDRQNCLDEISTIFIQIPWIEKIGIHKADVEKEIDFIVKRMEGYLTAKLSSRKTHTDDHQTMETEKEAHREVATEKELDSTHQQVAKQSDDTIVRISWENSKINYCDSFASALEKTKLEKFNSYNNVIAFNNWNWKQDFFPLSSYLQSDKNLSIYADAFKGIYVTLNAIDWKYQKEDPFNLNNFELLNNRRIPVHHLLIQKEKVLFLTMEEANALCDNPNYYNLTLGYIGKEDPLPKDVFYKVVKLKFLNGETYFNSEERELLKGWFKTHGVKKMHALYHEHIMTTDNKKKRKEYASSTLRQVFEEMM